MKNLDREGGVTGRCDKEKEMTSNLSSLIWSSGKRSAGRENRAWNMSPGPISILMWRNRAQCRSRSTVPDQTPSSKEHEIVPFLFSLYKKLAIFELFTSKIQLLYSIFELLTSHTN